MSSTSTLQRYSKRADNFRASAQLITRVHQSLRDCASAVNALSGSGLFSDAEIQSMLRDLASVSKRVG